MRLATVRGDPGTAAVRVDGDEFVVIPGADDVAALLRLPGWRARAAEADGPRRQLADARRAPVVTTPAKVICVGLNYRSHILEMGREPPEHPTLFAKFASSLLGPDDDIELPAVSDEIDWEAELAVVVGDSVRGASEADAAAAIAGFTVLNDVTARDWQYRTTQWMQGKAFDALTPLGPELVTADEWPGTSGRITCEVNGEIVQDADVADLVFGPGALVAYISQFTSLGPGDVIATGTPSGIGHARQPPRYLHDGDVVVTTVDAVGACHNVCREPSRLRRPQAASAKG